MDVSLKRSVRTLAKAWIVPLYRDRRSSRASGVGTCMRMSLTFYDTKERTKIACHIVRDCYHRFGDHHSSSTSRRSEDVILNPRHFIKEAQTLCHKLRARKIKDKTQSSWSLVSLVSFLTLSRHSGNVNPSLCCPPVNKTTYIRGHREPVVPLLLATRLSVVSFDGEHPYPQRLVPLRPCHSFSPGGHQLRYVVGIPSQ
jgi:hypothetical protein